MSERLSYENMAEIVDAHADALLLFARQWSDASAEDVVQEAFLQLVRRVKANDPPENVVAWLYRSFAAIATVIGVPGGKNASPRSPSVRTVARYAARRDPCGRTIENAAD
jgi:hypothetical protein